MVVDWLGSLFTGLYAESFQFPRFDHVMPAWLLLVGIGITVGTAVLGTFNAIVATVRLAPAEAMRAPAPGRYRRTLVERLGITRISPALQAAQREVESAMAERRMAEHDLEQARAASGVVRQGSAMAG